MSEKLKEEHDTHLRRELQEILKSNADRLTALQSLASEQRQASVVLKHERGQLAAKQARLPTLQSQCDSLQGKLRNLEHLHLTPPTRAF